MIRYTVLEQLNSSRLEQQVSHSDPLPIQPDDIARNCMQETHYMSRKFNRLTEKVNILTDVRKNPLGATLVI